MTFSMSTQVIQEMFLLVNQELTLKKVSIKANLFLYLVLLKLNKQ